MNELESRDGYVRCLAALHGFYASWEPALWAVLSRAVPELGDSGRERLAALERDLEALGVLELVRSSPSAVRPELASTGDALGASYVFEGAALGGQVIARHASRIQPPVPVEFFSGHGARTGEMWRRYGAVMEQWSQQHDDDERIVRGAVRCFAALEQWLATTGRDTACRAAGMGAQA